MSEYLNFFKVFSHLLRVDFTISPGAGIYKCITSKIQQLRTRLFSLQSLHKNYKYDSSSHTPYPPKVSHTHICVCVCIYIHISFTLIYLYIYTHMYICISVKEMYIHTPFFIRPAISIHVGFPSFTSFHEEQTVGHINKEH